MTTNSSIQIQRQPISYEERLHPRSEQQISLIVVHCTELPSMIEAREFGERVHHADSETGNCGHYYLNKDGSIIEFVSPNFVAHHVIGHNDYSIGIELVNLGRYPNWFHSKNQMVTDVYPQTQVNALILLLQHLVEVYPSLRSLAGHEDLDTTQLTAEDDSTKKIKRKIDPGPMFPWQQVMESVALTRVRSLSK